MSLDQRGAKFIYDRRARMDARERSRNKPAPQIDSRRPALKQEVFDAKDYFNKNMPEKEIQAKIVKHIRTFYPGTLFTISPSIFCMLPGLSKEHRSKILLHLYSMGYLKGTADLIIDEPRGKYYGMRLELKTEKVRTSKGKGLSDEQKKYIKAAIHRGFFARAAWGFEEARKWVDWYFGKGEDIK